MSFCRRYQGTRGIKIWILRLRSSRKSFIVDAGSRIMSVADRIKFPTMHMCSFIFIRMYKYNDIFTITTRTSNMICHTRTVISICRTPYTRVVTFWSHS
jgi:hypothetical protein